MKYLIQTKMSLLIKLSKQLHNNLLIYFLTVHSKTNLNQSADSNDYNAPWLVKMQIHMLI
jgi:hypothetical protein